jgi:hypothetical protein
MSQTLVLEITDVTWAELQRSAQVRYQRPEVAVNPDESGPLMRLFGSIHCNLTDGAERHDEYIGEALFSELRRTR